MGGIGVTTPGGEGHTYITNTGSIINWSMFDLPFIKDSINIAYSMFK